MKIFLIIPRPPVHPGGQSAETFRFRLFLRTVHPASRYGLGVLLTQGRQILDGAMFRHLRDAAGAWIETDNPAAITAALGLPQGEPGIQQKEKDMMLRIEDIRNALANAYGGFSQYGNRQIGEALAGQINNNNLLEEGSIVALCAEAARQECERWDDQDWDEAEVAAEIEAACKAALGTWGVGHAGQPVEMPSRERGVRGKRGGYRRRGQVTETSNE